MPVTGQLQAIITFCAFYAAVSVVRERPMRHCNPCCLQELGLSVARGTDHTDGGTNGLFYVGDHMPALASMHRAHMASQELYEQRLQSCADDGRIGAVCCWALLNLTRYTPAQVRCHWPRRCRKSSHDRDCWVSCAAVTTRSAARRKRRHPSFAVAPCALIFVTVMHKIIWPRLALCKKFNGCLHNLAEQTDCSLCVCACMQPQMARDGLFTLLQVAQQLGAGPRGAVACAVLREIQWHYRNVTLFYRAELRLKVQQLLAAGQVRTGHGCLCGLDMPACVVCTCGAHIDKAGCRALSSRWVVPDNT